MKAARLVVPLLVFAAAALPAGADTSFTGQLSGAQEAPPVASTATGSVTVVLNGNETQITVNMSFSGLSAPQTAAHLHGPAAPGVNAGVQIVLGVGQITGQTFAITPTQVGHLKAGLMYANVHTTAFPGGEIRAQLEYVPENVPVASPLGLAALCALIAAAGALVLLRR